MTTPAASSALCIANKLEIRGLIAPLSVLAIVTSEIPDRLASSGCDQPRAFLAAFIAEMIRIVCILDNIKLMGELALPG